jgi:hypothetical protein
VIVVGFPRAYVEEFFSGVRPAARVDNGVGIDNEEQGQRVWICAEPRRPWSAIWPQLKHYD